MPAGHHFGVYQSGYEEKVLDVGIGMCPDLTGHGLGTQFFAYVPPEVADRHPSVHIRLTVATFNQRAIKLYRKFGFVYQTQFERDGVVFGIMKRSAGSIERE